MKSGVIGRMGKETTATAVPKSNTVPLPEIRLNWV